MANTRNLLKSADRRKELALMTIGKFAGIPPRGLLATLAGIDPHTLLYWEKEDEKFKKDLEAILQEKRLDKARKLYKGFDKCVDEGHYPAIKDGLRAIDPDTWNEPEESKATTVNIMYLDIGPGRGNGKAKRIINGKHRLK